MDKNFAHRGPAHFKLLRDLLLRHLSAWLQIEVKNIMAQGVVDKLLPDALLPLIRRLVVKSWIGIASYDASYHGSIL